LHPQSSGGVIRPAFHEITGCDAIDDDSGDGHVLGFSSLLMTLVCIWFSDAFGKNGQVRFTLLIIQSDEEPGLAEQVYSLQSLLLVGEATGIIGSRLSFENGAQRATTITVPFMSWA
jgi:hypothetical protein